MSVNVEFFIKLVSVIGSLLLANPCPVSRSFSTRSPTILYSQSPFTSLLWSNSEPIMAKTLEKEVVAAIEMAIITAQKAGRHPDLHAIAAIFNCTYQSVCYIRRRIEKHQRTGLDERKKAGRKPMGDQEKMAESIKALLARRPELDQSAICDYLFDEHGVRICQATVSRLLKRNGIPHKISNKLYKKSKLFPTNEGQQVAEEGLRNMAGSLSMASHETYRSPYASTVPSRDVSFVNPTQAPSSNIDFGEPPSISTNELSLTRQPTELEIMAYSTPYS